MSSYLYSGLSYLGTAAYNAYYGAEPEVPEVDATPTPAPTQNPDPQIRAVGNLQGRAAPSTQSSLPVATYKGPVLEIDEDYELARRASLAHPQISSTQQAPLTPAATSTPPATQPVDDDEAQLQLALRLSEEHAKAQATIPKPQAVPSLPVAPAATSKAPAPHQQLGLDDDAALAEAIRQSAEHAKQSSTPPAPAAVSFSSKAPLTEEEEFQKILQLSLEESQAAATANTVGKSVLSSTTSTTSTSQSLAEQEAAHLELAMKHSMSKQQDEYVPMLGKRVPVTEIVAEKRRNVEKERAKIPLAQGDQKAMGYILGTIERNTLMADQLEALAPVYKFFQPVRGDGNCFYTSMAFDMLLSFAKLTPQQKTDLIAKFAKCNAPEASRAAAIAALQTLEKGQAIRGEDEMMLHFVQCLRAIGVQYVQNHRADLEPFLVDPMTYDKLIQDLGKMGVDAQEPMITAIVTALDYPIRIVRVTPGANNVLGTAGSFNYDGATRKIPADQLPVRVVLFTDGHYQLISKN